jgi:hypothetical protein
VSPTPRPRRMLRVVSRRGAGSSTVGEPTDGAGQSEDMLAMPNVGEGCPRGALDGQDEVGQAEAEDLEKANRALLGRGLNKLDLVAGAGFEPATSWL